MQINESLTVAVDAMRANKMRSILTTLGIIIGVTTIIGMMSIVQGLQNFMVQELSILGSSTFQVQKNPAVQFGRLDEKYRNRKRLTLEQAVAIRTAPAVKAVGPEDWQYGRVVRFREKKTNPNVIMAGATPEFQASNGYYVGEGRFITNEDVALRRNVIVLGLDIVEMLFPHSSAIGSDIRIDAQKYRVIGTLEEQGSTFGQSKDNFAIIPITTSQKYYGDKRSLNITVQAKNVENLDDAIEQTIGILRVKRKVPPGKPNDFEIFTSESLVDTFNDLTKYVKVAAVGIALISLLVGGIGIMNIMLVSVTERTREIGIRKSVGAKQSDILWQFMTEAIILSNIGGVLGIVLGILVGLLIGGATPLPTAIPLWSIFLGIGFCTMVGLFFGIYPAAKASRLHPIEALRYE
ncbi:MAG: ABC transporter permease [candidate division KSB1 bacterium]|jgi:putative ABC transport system permease protein|nr:ABC transporter permease [candidate division KSB1 bacterium]